MNISQAIDDAKNQLDGLTDSVQADVEILLCHVLQCNRTWLHTWPEKELTPEQTEQFNKLITARSKHQPVAYLTGKRGFWSFELEVNETTLIPRPETELLVETALEKIPQDAHWQVLDLGTGTGAIALAIAHERPQCHVTAIEKSNDALKTAIKNSQILNLKNITFLQGNWLEPVQSKNFDLIVSNPPYIAENDEHLSQGDVQHEPATALASGKDGLDDIRLIIGQAREHLNPGGWLMFEHGYDQHAAIFRLLKNSGYSDISQVKDLGGQVRVSIALRK